MAVPAGAACDGCVWMDYAGIEAFYGHPVQAQDGVAYGWCRQGPPAARQFASSGVYEAARKQAVLGVEWPEVRADDWCGSFRTSPPTDATTKPA